MKGSGYFICVTLIISVLFSCSIVKGYETPKNIHKYRDLINKVNRKQKQGKEPVLYTIHKGLRKNYYNDYVEKFRDIAFFRFLAKYDWDTINLLEVNIHNSAIRYCYIFNNNNEGTILEMTDDRIVFSDSSNIEASYFLKFRPVFEQDFDVIRDRISRYEGEGLHADIFVFGKIIKNQNKVGEYKIDIIQMNELTKDEELNLIQE